MLILQRKSTNYHKKRSKWISNLRKWKWHCQINFQKKKCWENYWKKNKNVIEIFKRNSFINCQWNFHRDWQNCFQRSCPTQLPKDLPEWFTKKEVCEEIFTEIIIGILQRSYCSNFQGISERTSKTFQNSSCMILQKALLEKFLK